MYLSIYGRSQTRETRFVYCKYSSNLNHNSISPNPDSGTRAGGLSSQWTLEVGRTPSVIRNTPSPTQTGGTALHSSGNEIHVSSCTKEALYFLIIILMIWDRLYCILLYNILV